MDLLDSRLFQGRASAAPRADHEAVLSGHVPCHAGPVSAVRRRHGVQDGRGEGREAGGFGWNPDKKKFGFNEKYSWRNAGFEQTDEHPVVNVSWNDAVAFCKWLSRKEGKTYDCQQRPSGNMPAVPGRQRGTTAATIPRRWPRSATWPTRRPRRSSRTGNGRSKPATATCSRLRWVSSSPMPSGSTTCTEMPGSGAADWYGEDYYAKSPVRRPNRPRLRRCPCPSGRFLEQRAGLRPFRQTLRGTRRLPGRTQASGCQDSVILWHLAVLPFAV